MNDKVIPKSLSMSKIVHNIGYLDKFSRYWLFKILKKIKFGKLTLIDEGQTYSFGSGQELSTTITVKKSSFYSRTLFGGSIGNAESYIDADWECSDLTALIRIFAKNRDLHKNLDNSVLNLLKPLEKTFHSLRSNTINGSKKNIQSHYDMGNGFFKLFLDPTMMYSSAIFKSSESSLEEASLEKLKSICEKLELKSSDHLLEIGTGWGGMAIYAAANYGCKVTTTTISKEQFNYATQKIKELGLENQINVILEDYRNLSGVYDKLVSIEMIEAVGLDNLDTYFKKCSELIRPEGLMVLQSITIRDHNYNNAKNSVDFIQRHVFPGSGIPSIASIMDAVAHNTDMIMAQQNDYAEDYAQTIHHWSLNFEQNTHKIKQLGYPELVLRLWRYYFAYCEGGFRERSIGLSHIVLTKPNYKDRSYL